MGSGVKYSEEFRAEVVRMVVEHSQPIRDVAEDAGVKPDTLRTWIHRARREGLPVTNKELSYAELEVKVRELEAAGKEKDKELADQRKRVEFLGKAASFFAAENYDRPTGSK